MAIDHEPWEFGNPIFRQALVMGFLGCDERSTKMRGLGTVPKIREDQISLEFFGDLISISTANDQTFSFFFLPLARVPRQPTADSRRWRTSWPTWCFLRRSARESMRRIPWLLKMILVHRRYHTHSLPGTATVKNLQNGWRCAITIYFPGQGKPLCGALFSEKSRKAHQIYQIFSAAGFRLESWSIPHVWKDRSFKTQPQNINISWDQLALRTAWIMWILVPASNQVDKLLDLASAGASVDQPGND